MKSRYQKAGMKTVLPAEASAKVDFRLVPDQEPEDILSKLRTHLDAFSKVASRLTPHPSRRGGIQRCGNHSIGRSLGVVEIDVLDGQQRLVAVGRGCYGTAQG